MATKKAEQLSRLGGSLGVMETLGLLPMVEALDAMFKAANIELVRYEKIGLGWALSCVAGNVGAVRVALEAGYRAADRLAQTGVAIDGITKILGAPPPFPPVSSCLLASPNPDVWDWVAGRAPSGLKSGPGAALGYVEVLGFVSAVLGLDAMLKGATVSFSGWGGIPPRIVLWVRGDVGAVRHAVDTATKLAQDGNRYLSHQVIARPETETAETIPARYDITALTSLALPFLSHRLRLAPPSKPAPPPKPGPAARPSKEG